MQNRDELSIRATLSRLGKVLPEAKPPKGRFLGARRAGSLVSVSGQVCRRADGSLVTGLVGGDVTLPQAVEAAEIAALNVLAQLVAAGVERLDQVESVLRMGVFVASAPGFAEHKAVGEGASDLLVALFGEAGWHSRAAVGVAALPGGAAVEVDAIVVLHA